MLYYTNAIESGTVSNPTGISILVPWITKLPPFWVVEWHSVHTNKQHGSMHVAFEITQPAVAVIPGEAADMSESVVVDWGKSSLVNQPVFLRMCKHAKRTLYIKRLAVSELIQRVFSFIQ